MSAAPQVYEVLSPIPALGADVGDLVVVHPWDPMPISVVRFHGPASLTHLYENRSQLKQLAPASVSNPNPEPPLPTSPRGVLELVR